MSSSEKTPECCPPFDPTLWEDKMLEWYDKPFVKERVRTLFYMPMNFGSAIRKADAKITAAGAVMKEWLCLSDHTSKWNMDIYLAVDKEVPGADMERLSGTYYSKVYEGDFKETGKWCSDYSETVKSREMEIEKMYMWYTTCPKCAKKYGKNYVVIISKVSPKK